MSGIMYVRGDATVPSVKGVKLIAHVCNDIGGWGRGFVLALSRRWPEPEKAYRAWHRDRAHNDFGLGAAQFVQVEPYVWVANLIGQRGIRRGSKGFPSGTRRSTRRSNGLRTGPSHSTRPSTCPVSAAAWRAVPGRVSSRSSPSGWCSGRSR